MSNVDYEILFSVLLHKVANCPFCHCGKEPYVDGEQCPTCDAIVLRESLQTADLLECQNEQ